MIFRIILALLLLALPLTRAEAQRKPNVDSLVAKFIDRGIHAQWSPSDLFDGCPALEDWQRRGIDLLLRAELSAERAALLASAWMFPLKTCRSAELEAWYIRHANAEIGDGGESRHMLSYWLALQHGDSPAIREYLSGLMLDARLPQRVRDIAGESLFMRFTPEEHRREYLRTLETMSFPNGDFAAGQTTKQLKYDADGLLRDVAQRVRRNPAITDQAAFRLIVESSDRYASQSARQAFGQSLAALANREDLAAHKREQLKLDARHVMRPGK